VTAIRAADLRKTYGSVRALRGLSLSVDSGEAYGFLGANGAGKTTAIRILTGQLAPDSGEASVLGVDPAVDPIEVRRRVGVLPEQESPPSFLSPREYFEFVGAVRGLDDAAIEDRVAAWADRLAFREKLDTLCADLSRGQQQKVMLTAAFLHDPAAVFVDEPLVNLDPVMQERAKELLTSYRDDGNAVFISTHQVELAASLCDRVGIVAEGQLQTVHRPADLAAEGESLLDAFLAAT
jgi:ABC-2 type transport system ATP-binding protein